MNRKVPPCDSVRPNSNSSASFGSDDWPISVNAHSGSHCPKGYRECFPGTTSEVLHELIVQKATGTSVMHLWANANHPKSEPPQEVFRPIGFGLHRLHAWEAGLRPGGTAYRYGASRNGIRRRGPAFFLGCATELERPRNTDREVVRHRR